MSKTGLTIWMLILGAILGGMLTVAMINVMPLAQGLLIWNQRQTSTPVQVVPGAPGPDNSNTQLPRESPP